MRAHNVLKKRIPSGINPDAKLNVKKGDTVMVITGKDKGKTGVIKKVLRSEGKVVVEGVNIIKKAVRGNPMTGQRGGIIEMEAPLYVSKVMVYHLKTNQPSRVGRTAVKGDDGKTRRVRFAKKSNEHLD